MATAKRQVFISAKGKAAPYCSIQKPDFGTTEFPQPRGEYKVNLIVPIKDAQADIKRITKIYEESYAAFVEEHEANPPKVAAGKRPVPVRQGELPFFEDGNGNVVFKFKCYASWKNPKTSKIKSRIGFLFGNKASFTHVAKHTLVKLTILPILQHSTQQIRCSL